MVDEQQISENQPDNRESEVEAASLKEKPDASPEQAAVEPEPSFGWTSYAERINGRFAMIGFVALIILELVTHQSFFEWLFN
ncbi:MAG: chlorophyll a/b-binding protein [Leptolyngbyaceae bacterium]|nr:chlorophyll a/b-binding protein [Leptolyngbyaceae bacterium]